MQRITPLMDRIRSERWDNRVPPEKVRELELRNIAWRIKRIEVLLIRLAQLNLKRLRK